eukprot:gene19570-51378_t
MGPSPLYDLIVSVDGGAPTTRRVGFRTVRLVQDPVAGQVGRTFGFEVNGHAVFMKGANWIPADAFESRGYFDSFAAANYNTLRVWGGGVYQQDAFYDLADERGILVWQELMFACALYPTDPSFLLSVRAEVADQVRRLQHHPSVAVWSANNENEAALVQNWYGDTNPAGPWPEYRDMYRELYWDTALAAIAPLDATRPVLASSPSAGNETRDDPTRDDCNDDDTGDVHVFEYDTDCWNTSLLRNTRFASEYGLQSFSSAESLEQHPTVRSAVTAPEDREWGSPWMEQRQHCDKWCDNGKMRAQAERHFRWPSAWADQLYMTQVQQAYCMKVQTEHHRRNRGPRRTMGALYWQANDIWPTVSWSGLEHGGRWKMLHHFAAHFFAPLLISFTHDGASWEAWAVSDRPAPTHATVEWRLHQWGSGAAVAAWSARVRFPANGAARVGAGGLLLRGGGACATAAECVLTAEVSADGDASANFFLLGSPKDAATMRDPRPGLGD